MALVSGLNTSNSSFAEITYEKVRNIWLSDDPPTPPAEEVSPSVIHHHDSSTPLSVKPRDPIVAIVGVGYVGLHLVTAFGHHYRIIAHDVSKDRLASIEKKTASLPDAVISSDPSILSTATHILVAVPTLVQSTGTIDTTFVRNALASIATHVRPGTTIVIESSVAVGMTRNLLKDLVVTRRLKAGMSPERVDPGRTFPAFQDIPKIISGLDDISPGSLDSIQELYGEVFTTLVPVSSPEVAEMAKLYENSQRLICIAYANEMADACDALSINPFEVARAAATKPFGYLPITPSAGVGGHCIPVNPHYLFATGAFPLLRQATQVTAARPAAVMDRAMETLVEFDAQRPQSRLGTGRTARVLVVGVGFKRGQGEVTNSPGLAAAERAQAWGAEIAWADPLVAQETVPHLAKFDHVRLWHQLGLSWFDLIVVAVPQAGLDLECLERLPRTVVERWCA